MKHNFIFPEMVIKHQKPLCANSSKFDIAAFERWSCLLQVILWPKSPGWSNSFRGRKLVAAEEKRVQCGAISCVKKESWWSKLFVRYTALCVLCSVGYSVLKNWNHKNHFPIDKNYFWGFFFLCSFRMKTLKIVSVFIFQHWKHYFWNTQNR